MTNNTQRCLPCPLCWHEQVIHKLKHNDAKTFKVGLEETLEWCPAFSSATSQQVTRWDRGHWSCPNCEANFTIRDLIILQSAVFRPFPWGMREEDWQRLEWIKTINIDEEEDR